MITGHMVTRDKASGIVIVEIYDSGISTQKADSLARGMFVVPVKLVTVQKSENFERREYNAIGWL